MIVVNVVDFVFEFVTVAMASSESTPVTTPGSPPRMVTEAAAVAAIRSALVNRDDYQMEHECGRFAAAIKAMTPDAAFLTAKRFVAKHTVFVDGVRGCYCDVIHIINRGQTFRFKSQQNNPACFDVWRDYNNLPDNVQAMITAPRDSDSKGQCWCCTFHHVCDCRDFKSFTTIKRAADKALGAGCEATVPAKYHRAKAVVVTRKRARRSTLIVPSWLTCNPPSKQRCLRRLKLAEDVYNTYDAFKACE